MSKISTGNTTVNVMITGVGGQGVLLASELISKAALDEGYDIKKSEVHGMAQRGGSVVSNVRFGEKVFSPLISQGEADILLSFERMETLRWLDYIHDGTVIIANQQKIVPMTVTTTNTGYPEDVQAILEGISDKVYMVDALDIARQAGNIRTANVALIGAMSAHLDIPLERWEQVIKEQVPPKTLEANMKAFRLAAEGQ